MFVRFLLLKTLAVCSSCFAESCLGAPQCCNGVGAGEAPGGAPSHQGWPRHPCSTLFPPLLLRREGPGDVSEVEAACLGRARCLLSLILFFANGCEQETLWLLTAFSQLYAALTNELGKERVRSPREVKLLPRLKHWSCQAAQSRASHQFKHPRVGRALLREGSSPAGEGKLRDARLPMKLTPCSSALLWAGGGPTATSGRMQRLHPSAFMPFFLLVVGKLQQGGLGKD